MLITTPLTFTSKQYTPRYIQHLVFTHLKWHEELVCPIKKIAVSRFHCLVTGILSSPHSPPCLVSELTKKFQKLQKTGRVTNTVRSHPTILSNLLFLTQAARSSGSGTGTRWASTTWIGRYLDNLLPHGEVACYRHAPTCKMLPCRRKRLGHFLL